MVGLLVCFCVFGYRRLCRAAVCCGGGKYFGSLSFCMDLAGSPDGGVPKNIADFI